MQTDKSRFRHWLCKYLQIKQLQMVMDDKSSRRRRRRRRISAGAVRHLTDTVRKSAFLCLVLKWWHWAKFPTTEQQVWPWLRVALWRIMWRVCRCESENVGVFYFLSFWPLMIEQLKIWQERERVTRSKGTQAGSRTQVRCRASAHGTRALPTEPNGAPKM